MGADSNDSLSRETFAARDIASFAFVPCKGKIKDIASYMRWFAALIRETPTLPLFGLMLYLEAPVPVRRSRGFLLIDIIPFLY